MTSVAPGSTGRVGRHAEAARRLLPGALSGTGLTLILLSAAVGLALYGVLSSGRNTDDYWALAYVTEILSDSSNLKDPFLGTDVDVQARFRLNIWIWGIALVSEATGAEGRWLVQELAPPILAVASLGAIFVMLRASRLVAPAAAFGCLAWVGYMISANDGPRLAGTFFFSRIAQDKALVWLVLAPAILASAVALSTAIERLGGYNGSKRWNLAVPRLGSWGAVCLLSLSALTLVATLIHPFGIVFAGVLATAAILARAWSDGWKRIPGALVVWSGLALVPGLLAAATWRFIVPADVAREFDADLYRPNTYTDVGPLSMADADQLALLNLLALAWIAISLYRRSDSEAMRLSAVIYLLTIPIFVPGVADVMSRLVSADGAWRYTWLLPIAAVLSFADFAQWLLLEARSKARTSGFIVAGVATAVVLLAGSFTAGNRTGGRISDEQERVLEVLDDSTRGADERVTVLAGRGLSQFIPTFVENANPIFFPFLAEEEELAVEGGNRMAHTRIIESPESAEQVMRLVRFWDASFVVLERDALDGRPPRALVSCLITRHYRLLVVRSERDMCSARGS